VTEPLHDPFDEGARIDPLIAAKPSRRLHWWAAGAVGLVGLAAYGVQTVLGGLRAQEPDRAAAAEAPAALAEPRLERLQQELARQQEATPAPQSGASAPNARRRLSSAALPAASTSPRGEARISSAARDSAESQAPPPEGGGAEPLPDSRRYEVEKRDNAIAASRILALQHQEAQPDSPAKVPALERPPSGAAAEPVDGRAGAAGLELLKRIERVAAEAGGDRTAAARDWLAARRAESDSPVSAATVATVRPPASKYLVVQGSVLPAVLLTEIRSDLPGVLSAQVTDDVYDSVAASALLVPRGTKLVGEYDSRILDGQSAVLAAFGRLIFPNGSSVQLGAMPAADASGAAGLGGSVDTHFWARFGTQFLTAAIARVVQRRDGTYGLLGPGGAVVSPDAAGQILVESMRFTPRSVAALGPTITVRRGTRFDVVVNRDLSLDPAITGVR
jgi:type IV secretion system protein TrbI